MNRRHAEGLSQGSLVSGLSGPCQWSGHPQVSLARCGGQLSFSIHLVQNLPESQRERAVICEVSRSVRFQGLLHRTLRKSWIIVVEGNSAIWTPPHPQPQSPRRVTIEGEGEREGPLASASTVSLLDQRQQGKQGPKRNTFEEHKARRSKDLGAA